MTPIPIYIIPRAQVEEIVGTSPPIPAPELAKYLESRPGILSDGACDIFQENCRSAIQRWKRFDLFQVVDAVSPGVVVVFPPWLELFQEHCPANIEKCLSWLREMYPDNVCLCQWNHDKPSDNIEAFADMDPAKFVLLTFNVSTPRNCDLPVPFWAISTDRKSPKPERTYKANFLGQSNGELRRNIKYAIKDRPGYFWSDDRVPEQQYLDVLADSWFTLCPRGGGLNSYRFFESIQVGSIPVLFADDVYLPFSDTIDYRKFSVRIPERFAGDFGMIETILNAVDKHRMVQMCGEYRERLSLAGIQMRTYQKLKWMTGEWEATR